jgi:hypothetical protein
MERDSYELARLPVVSMSVLCGFILPDGAPGGMSYVLMTSLSVVYLAGWSNASIRIYYPEVSNSPYGRVGDRRFYSSLSLRPKSLLTKPDPL